MAQSLFNILGYQRVAEAFYFKLFHCFLENFFAIFGVLDLFNKVARYDIGAHKQALACLQLTGERERFRMLYLVCVLQLVVMCVIIDCRVSRTLGQQEKLRAPVFDMRRRLLQLQQCVLGGAHRQAPYAVAPFFFSPFNQFEIKQNLSMNHLVKIVI